MFSILLGIQILISIAIITLVMLQQGKGADMGAGFGAGAAGTVFGARGSGSFFTRATAILATVFFINCLLIASPLVRESGNGDSLADRLEAQSVQEQTAVEAGAVVEALEQAEEAARTEAGLDDLPADIPAAPDVPAAPGANDLPD